MQITANGIQLEYEDHGPQDGPALVLVRGLGSQLVHWPTEFVQGFAALGYRTIIFDNRDVGRSQHFPKVGVVSGAASIAAHMKAGKVFQSAYVLSDMGNDIIGLLDALNIAKAHILGISMGAAITAAITQQERLLSAILIMSAGPNPLPPETLQQLLAEPMDLQQAQDGWIKVHQDWGSPGFPVDDDYIREQATCAWHRGHDATGINRQILAILKSPDRNAKMAAMKLPCLVIHGADDALIPPDVGRKIAGLIPGAQLEIVKGMGHIITPSLAPVIVDMVHGFLDART